MAKQSMNDNDIYALEINHPSDLDLWADDLSICMDTYRLYKPHNFTRLFQNPIMNYTTVDQKDTFIYILLLNIMFEV